VNQNAYVGTGRDTNSVYLDDFYEYNPSSDTWTQKNNFAGTPRFDAKGFSIGQKGFITTGLDTNNQYKSDLWEYDASNDTWIQRAPMPTVSRKGSAGFATSYAFYIGTGIDSSNTRLGDFWEYAPDTLTGMTDAGRVPADITVFPNPAKELLAINYSLTGKEDSEIILTDIDGNEIYHARYPGGSAIRAEISVNRFAEGMYFLLLRTNDHRLLYVKKILISH